MAKRRRPGRRTARRVTGMDMQCLHAPCLGKVHAIYPLAFSRQSSPAASACICPKEQHKQEQPLAPRMQQGINTPRKHACATSTSEHDNHRERDASGLLFTKVKSAGVFKTDSDTPGWACQRLPSLGCRSLHPFNFMKCLDLPGRGGHADGAAARAGSKGAGRNGPSVRASVQGFGPERCSLADGRAQFHSCERGRLQACTSQACH